MKLLFAYPDNIALANNISDKTGVALGEFELRRFPDQESYVRLLSEVNKKEIYIVCSLNNPDDKIMSLLFFSKILRENGAKKITLVAPYLSYMRQDGVFNDGEGISAKYFASLISVYFDELITVDPHAHRLKLEDIYTIPTQLIHAAPAIAEWLRDQSDDLLLIGPDIESEQWVSHIAKQINAPYEIVSKKRLSDTEVEITLPDLKPYHGKKPVIIDDIISSGGTLMSLIRHLNTSGFENPLCVVVHALYDETSLSYSNIVSTNAVKHPSNQIDISDLFKANLI